MTNPPKTVSYPHDNETIQCLWSNRSSSGKQGDKFTELFRWEIDDIKQQCQMVTRNTPLTRSPGTYVYKSELDMLCYESESVVGWVWAPVYPSTMATTLQRRQQIVKGLPADKIPMLLGMPGEEPSHPTLDIPGVPYGNSSADPSINNVAAPAHPPFLTHTRQNDARCLLLNPRMRAASQPPAGPSVNKVQVAGYLGTLGVQPRLKRDGPVRGTDIIGQGPVEKVEEDQYESDEPEQQGGDDLNLGETEYADEAFEADKANDNSLDDAMGFSNGFESQGDMDDDEDVASSEDETNTANTRTTIATNNRHAGRSHPKLHQIQEETEFADGHEEEEDMENFDVDDFAREDSYDESVVAELNVYEGSGSENDNPVQADVSATLRDTATGKILGYRPATPCDSCAAEGISCYTAKPNGASCRPCTTRGLKKCSIKTQTFKLIQSNLAQLRTISQSMYRDVSMLHRTAEPHSQAFDRMKAQIRSIAKLVDSVGEAKLATWPDKIRLSKAFEGQMQRDELLQKEASRSETTNGMKRHPVTACVGGPSTSGTRPPAKRFVREQSTGSLIGPSEARAPTAGLRMRSEAPPGPTQVPVQLPAPRPRHQAQCRSQFEPHNDSQAGPPPPRSTSQAPQARRRPALAILDRNHQAPVIPAFNGGSKETVKQTATQSNLKPPARLTRSRDASNLGSAKGPGTADLYDREDEDDAEGRDHVFVDIDPTVKRRATAIAGPQHRKRVRKAAV